VTEAVAAKLTAIGPANEQQPAGAIFGSHPFTLTSETSLGADETGWTAYRRSTGNCKVGDRH
ncbi:MAG: hypothetical protein AAGK78_03600, partial [Planctomycetota bacterium]